MTHPNDEPGLIEVLLLVAAVVLAGYCLAGCSHRQPLPTYTLDGWDMWRGPDGDWLLSEPRLRESGQPYNRPATHRWGSTDGTPRGMYLRPITDEECER